MVRCFCANCELFRYSPGSPGLCENVPGLQASMCAGIYFIWQGWCLPPSLKWLIVVELGARKDQRWAPAPYRACQAPKRLSHMEQPRAQAGTEARDPQDGTADPASHHVS